MKISFLSRGPREQVSGGYLYNRYLIERLEQDGHAIDYFGEAPDRSALEVTDVAIIDSLLITEIAPLLMSVSSRLVLLLHVVPDAVVWSQEQRATFRALCRNARIIVTGDRTLELLRKTLSDRRLPARKVEPGVPGFWRPKERYSNSARRLLGIANYLPGKGIERMLATLRLLTDLPWTMSVYGNRDLDPAYYVFLNGLLDEYGLRSRVELNGTVPHPSVNRLMQEADLLVHLSRWESYSMVTAEAIACGLPVLSYPTGAFSVFGQSGLVRYVEQSGTAEAEELARLISDASAYARLRPNDGLRVRTFDDVGREFIACLEEVAL